jgi:D-alanyl-D-alanine carboxypeptidase
MPSLGTVETVANVGGAPPNLREEMCGAHRKRQATEDEDEALQANVSGDSPYAIFLSSLRPKAKGALLHESGGGEQPVLVYTGPYRKPGEPIPASALTDPPKSKATAKSKSGGKTAAGNASGAGSDAPAKPKAKATTTPAKPAPKPSQSHSNASQQTTQTR